MMVISATYTITPETAGVVAVGSCKQISEDIYMIYRCTVMYV